jgi:hypothetical protein
MNRVFLISVLLENMQDDEIEYIDVISWSYNNINSKNVISLTEEELKAIINKTSIFDIINEENKSMIGPWEDDTICDPSIISAIYNKLILYSKNTFESFVSEFLMKLIQLFQYAIAYKKHVYFLF